MARLISACIYCGSTEKLTKEHIFGRWHREIPSSGIKTSHRTSYRSRNGAIIELGRLNRPGAPGSHQIKIACEHCNRGWGSSVQALAKMPTLRLATEKAFGLNSSDRKAVANWAIMATMSLEYATARNRVIPQRERDHLRINAEPPENYKVFISRFVPAKTSYIIGKEIQNFTHLAISTMFRLRYSILGVYC